MEDKIILMPATCDICGNEFSYDKVTCEVCSVGYEHSFCKKCFKNKVKMYNEENMDSINGWIR